MCERGWVCLVLHGCTRQCCNPSAVLSWVCLVACVCGSPVFRPEALPCVVGGAAATYLAGVRGSRTPPIVCVFGASLCVCPVRQQSVRRCLQCSSSWWDLNPVCRAAAPVRVLCSEGAAGTPGGSRHWRLLDVGANCFKCAWVDACAIVPLFARSA